jgi:hypothetical protein
MRTTMSIMKTRTTRCTPLSDTEGEKLYRDVEEMESYGAEAPVPTDSL